MKLLIDLSHIAHANWNFSASKGIDLWKHSMLMSILSYIEKFNPSETILATDRPSWREKSYQYYKIRKRKSDKTNTDKQFFRKELNGFIEELQQHFPLTTLSIPDCEADDIIGVLAPTFEDVTIVSKDKDFNQLLKYPQIKIYDPRTHEFVSCEDPDKFLYVQILRGDATDDVPNFLSDDDTFDNPEKKQITLREKFIEELLKDGYQLNSEYSYVIPQSLKDFAIKKFTTLDAIEGICKNTDRNRKMIDFQYIPRLVRYNILKTYNEKEKQVKVEQKSLEEYLYKKDLVQVLSKVNLFFRGVGS